MLTSHCFLLEKLNCLSFSMLFNGVANTIMHTLIFVYIFYFLYILIMGIYRAHLQKKLVKFTFALCIPWIVIGVLFDVLSNIFIVPFVFLELPKEWLVTQRLARYLADPNPNWRTTIAKYICLNLLDPFDPSGHHCTK